VLQAASIARHTTYSVAARAVTICLTDGSEKRMRYGKVIRAITTAVADHRLSQIFRPADVNRVLGINFAGTFLAKHRVGNPGGNTELFVRLGPGGKRPALYHLRSIAAPTNGPVAIWDGQPKKPSTEHDSIYGEV
jgi:hypothetical protein